MKTLSIGWDGNTTKLSVMKQGNILEECSLSNEGANVLYGTVLDGMTFRHFNKGISDMRTLHSGENYSIYG